MKYAFTVNDVIAALLAYLDLDAINQDEVGLKSLSSEDDEVHDIFIMEIKDGQRAEKGVGVTSGYGDFGPLGDAGDCGGSEAGTSFGRVRKQSKQDEKSDS